MAVFEHIGDDIRAVGFGNVIDFDVFYAGFGKLYSQNISGVFGVAVHRGVGDDHTLFFGGIACPFLMFVQNIINARTPDEAVKGADHFDVERSGFFEKRGDIFAVFADDVGVIAAGFGNPIAVIVDFVVEKLAVQSFERTESVGGEEHAVCAVEAYHDLRPVDHRRGDKGEFMSAERAGVAVFDDIGIFDVVAELLGKGFAFGCRNDGDIGIAQ